MDDNNSDVVTYGDQVQERERQRWTPWANSQRTKAPLSVTDPTAKTDADVDHHYDDPVEADDKPMLLTH